MSYRSAHDLRQALRSHGVQLDAFVRERFLTRVATAPVGGNWLLKGGVGLLARVPSARATRDIDFGTLSAVDEKQIRDELLEICSLHLDDFLIYQLLSLGALEASRQQSNRVGWRAVIQPILSGRALNKFSIDVVAQQNVGVSSDRGDTSAITSTLGFENKLPRLLAIEIQVAEKAFALMPRPDGAPNSRARDFFDLALISITQVVRGLELSEAIAFESFQRGLELGRLLQNQAIRDFYEREARKSPLVLQIFSDFDQAFEGVNRLLFDYPQDMTATWSPKLIDWQ